MSIDAKEMRTSSNLRLLDLYCGAGGAGMGYHRAGFSEIVGVDIHPQPNYPFTFWRRDALSLTYEELLSFDLITASPPCQAYSRGSALARKRGKVYPDLIDPTRRMLEAASKPYVIENVLGAPLRPDISLCGTMFGLKVQRHRYFETNIRNLGSNLVCNHDGSVVDGDYVTVAGSGGHGRGSFKLWQDAMQIDWMTKDEIRESIPPAFTQHIGELIQVLIRTGQLEIRSASKMLERRRDVPGQFYPQTIRMF